MTQEAKAMCTGSPRAQCSHLGVLIPSRICCVYWVRLGVPEEGSEGGVYKVPMAIGVYPTGYLARGFASEIRELSGVLLV